MADTLYVTGKTSDGKVMLGGVFRFFETHGMPLDELFQLLDQRDNLPDWLAFYDEAKAAGMKRDRILSKLEGVIDDSYGHDFRVEVIRRLEALR